MAAPCAFSAREGGGRIGRLIEGLGLSWAFGWSFWALCDVSF